MTVLRRLFPLLGSFVAVSLLACGEDAAAPAPVAAASGAAGASAGSAGASAGTSAAGSAGTAAGGTKAGGAGGGGAGSNAGSGGGTPGGSGPGGAAGAAGAAGSAGGTGGTQTGGAGGQLPAGSCKLDADCPQTVETFPANCAEGYCGTDSKCRFRAKDEDGDGARKKTCQGLGTAVVELGQDCNDADKDTRPGAWDGPADGPLPNRCGDGVDQDCSGIADDGVATTGATCVCVPADVRDCNEDANGQTITWPKLDAANKPVGECKRGSQTCTAQGKWGPCTNIKAPLKELCDKKDNDCDGEVDNGPPADAPYWLYDGDKDLHAPAGYAPVQACEAPVTNPAECGNCGGVDATGKSLWRTNIPDDDCNDEDNAIKPGQAEVCNGDGVDHNCDGVKNDPNPALLQCDCTDGDVVDCARATEVYPGDKPTDGYPLASGPALQGICTWGKKQCVGGKWGVCNGGKGRDGVEELCNGDNLDHDCDGQTNAQECACTAGDTKKCGNCDLGTSRCVGTTNPAWDACDYAGDPRGEYCEDKDGDGVCGPCTANVCPVDVAGRKLESACTKVAGVRALDCDDNPATGALYGANAKGACKTCVPGAGPNAPLSKVNAPGGSWDWDCDGQVEYADEDILEIPNEFGSFNGSSSHDLAIVAAYCLAQPANDCTTGNVYFTTRTWEGPGDDGICGRETVRSSCTYQPAQGKCLQDAGGKAYDELECK